MHTSTCVTSKDNAKSNDSDRIFVIRENMRLKHRCPYDSNNSHSPFLQCALLIGKLNETYLRRREGDV